MADLYQVKKLVDGSAYGGQTAHETASWVPSLAHEFPDTTR